ncbi:ParB/RepB/Spo0J family partition protein [Megalodesulfovibrio gigas]|uniref:Putative parB-like partition protein n=1 Tax=Megalodesulfovibrio gigas (strain ATCC 19364 / DSM 1382 / NCIMB 9332 / VKM B-1759) TaxID=1121448 RepID=T2G8Y1_MEGG1|nr:ParB/RepB/Spo0J family partition protein [Megalodesulfovibrio gigas]AGW12753.1 putative parB-like partition protein [Megalodesulfovibrio gigas DSM 1382 = ATCC 19364]
MAAMQRGLGKGLDALLRGAADASGDVEVRQLPLDSIAPNPNQPRREFPEASLQELAESIAAQGVIQPVLVRRAPGGSEKSYELVAGERRLRASLLAGKTHIPAQVRQIDDTTSLVIAIIENLQREDLNPLDEAQGLQQLQTRLALSQEALARQVGKSRPAVANALRLLQLPQAIQEQVRSGGVSAGHARALLGIADVQAQQTLLERILHEELSVREVEALAAWWKEHGAWPDAMEAAAPLRPARRTPSKTTGQRDVLLTALQSRLKQTFPCKVAVRGSADKGQIVLSYASMDELQALTHKLGLSEAPSQEEAL